MSVVAMHVDHLHELCPLVSTKDNNRTDSNLEFSETVLSTE